MHRSERSSHFNNHRMAIRYQNGLLFRRLVVEPELLLLGNRRRRYCLRIMASVEWSHRRTLDHLHFVCSELSPHTSFNLDFISLVRVLIHRCSPSEVFGQICCWFWYLRNQSHLGWLQYERLPWIRYMGYQKYNTSASVPLTDTCIQLTWSTVGISFSL